MPPRAIVFDLDDTLFAEREFVQSGFAAVDRWLRDAQMGSGFGDEARRLFAAGVRGHIFDEALRRLGVAGAAALVPQLVEVYRGHLPQLALLPDAQWALDHFRGRFKLGLITDGYARIQRNKVAALGIGDRFDTIVFTDDHGRENWKPSPAPYRRIMDELGCGGADCVYVGDNPAKDFIAPNRLGWLTVQIVRDGAEYGSGVIVTPPADQQAKRVIRSLRELEGICND